MKKQWRLLFFLSLCICLIADAVHARGMTIRDAEIEALLHDYNNPLLRAAGLDPKNVHIGIINSPAINAFVTGGQNIFYHTGLILEADRPNVVIGVAAHEIGHITGGHLSRQSEAAKSANIPVVAGMILGLGSALAGAGDAAIMMITGGIQIGQQNYLSYSRVQESAADQTALRLLNYTGQSAQGVADLMNELSEQEILNEIRQDPYVRSHPLSRTRVNTYLTQAQTSPHFNQKDSPKLQFRHDMVKAKIRGFLEHPQTALRFYPQQDQSAPARYARAIAYHRLAQTEQAIALIDGLIMEMPDNPYLYELKGQIYQESGLPNKAIPAYEKALQLAPETALFFTSLGTARLAIGRQEIEKRNIPHGREYTEHALLDLREAIRLEPKNISAYFQLSIAYGLLEQFGHAEWAIAEFYAVRNNPQALTHAKRALQKLSPSDSEYLRAQDIAQSIKPRQSRR